MARLRHSPYLKQPILALPGLGAIALALLAVSFARQRETPAVVMVELPSPRGVRCYLPPIPTLVGRRLRANSSAPGFDWRSVRLIALGRDTSRVDGVEAPSPESLREAIIAGGMPRAVFLKADLDLPFERVFLAAKVVGDIGAPDVCIIAESADD